MSSAKEPVRFKLNTTWTFITYNLETLKVAAIFTGRLKGGNIGPLWNPSDFNPRTYKEVGGFNPPHPPLLYHGGGMNLRVRPRVNGDCDNYLQLKKCWSWNSPKSLHTKWSFGAEFLVSLLSFCDEKKTVTPPFLLFFSSLWLLEKIF